MLARVAELPFKTQLRGKATEVSEQTNLFRLLLGMSWNRPALMLVCPENIFFTNSPLSTKYVKSNERFKQNLEIIERDIQKGFWVAGRTIIGQYLNFEYIFSK